MELHLETLKGRVIDHGRSSAAGASLDEAMKLGEEAARKQESQAAHLYVAPSGNAGFGNGELVAVYTPRSGFVKLGEDVRPWWDGLSADAQRELIANAHGPLPTSVAPAAASTLGGAAMGAHIAFEGSEGWRLRPEVATFVETMEFAPWREAPEA